MARPEIMGPRMFEVWYTVEFSAIAFSRLLRGTRLGTIALRAGVLSAWTAPPKKVNT